MHDTTRRNVLGAGLALGATLLTDTSAFADDALALRADDGSAVPNIRVPSELSPNALPGIVWVGAEQADATLIEFFDYNCTWCRKAVTDLDALLKKDNALRVGLVNYAIFGVGSVQAAKVQQAVLKLYGPARAYAFHRAMFSRRGQNDGGSALAVVGSLGLNAAQVTEAANGDDVTRVLTRQAKLAEALGFNATPSFTMNGVGILGYPGPRTIAGMVASVRQCEKIACG